MYGIRPSEVDEMVRRYRSGESLGAIGRSFGVGPSLVRARLAARGVAIRDAKASAPRAERLRGIDVDAFVRRYAAGESMSSAAIAAGVSRVTFRRWLIARGVAIRGPVEAQSLATPRWRPVPGLRGVQVADEAAR